MNKNYALFIDSGIGGLSTLALSIKKLPANYIYYADTKYAPYGNLASVFIRQRLKKIITHLSVKYDIKCVVLACNTASTTALHYLKKELPFTSVFGVKPTLKNISTKFKFPAIVATPKTISNLKKISNKNIVLLPMKSFATEIETFLIRQTFKNKFNLIKSIFTIKKETEKCDCLILGCTHYCLIANYIKNFIFLPIFDGNLKCVKQFISTTKTKSTKPSIKFIISSEDEKLKQKYIKILKQILANKNKLC